MKRVFYTFLLSVFMASCSNAVSSPTVTVTPQATSTLTPTVTPTITPTITLTPTETPDPNMPSDATGKDPSTGEYTKTVDDNGKTVVYVWKQFQFGDDSKNGVAGHWFRSWMADGPINLTGYGENCEFVDSWGEPLSTFTLNMDVYAVENQTDLDKMGYIFHPDRESEWKEANRPCGSLSLPYSIMSDLFLRYIKLLPGEFGESSWDRYLRERDYYAPGGTPTPEDGQRSLQDHQAFAKALNDGSMTIKIGNDDWIPERGYEVYWINESMAVNDPTMIVNLQGSTIKSYYLKMIAKDGKLIAFIAPGSWLKDKLAWPKADSRERIFRTMILFPLEAAITSTYPIKNATLIPFQNYQGITGIISGTNFDGSSFHINTPFIDFSPVP